MILEENNFLHKLWSLILNNKIIQQEVLQLIFKRLKFSGIFLMILALIFGFAGCDGPGSSSDDYVVDEFEVLVVDKEGNSITDATVDFAGEGSSVNEEGVATFQNISDGYYELEVQCDDYEKYYDSSVKVGEENQQYIAELGSGKLSLTGSFENSGMNENTVLKMEETIPTQIMIIYEDDFEIVELNDDEFSLEVERNKPSGIVFLNDSDEYLGFLTLENGLDSIPAQFVEEKTEEIDFGEIDFKDEEGIPANNPIGDEINVNESERNLLAFSDSFFAATLRNPEVIELLAGDELDEFSLSIAYHFDHIKYWDWEDYNTINFNKMIGKEIEGEDGTYPYFQMHRYRLSTRGREFDPEEVVLKYPDNDVWSSITDEPQNDDPHYFHFNGIYSHELDDTNILSSYAPGGEYIFKLNDLEIPVEIPADLKDQTQKNSFLALPSFHLVENDEGLEIIDEITLEYKTKNGNDLSSDFVENILSTKDDTSGIELYLFIKDGSGHGEKIEEVRLDPGEKRYSPENDMAWEVPEDIEADEFYRLTVEYHDFYGMKYIAYYWNEEDYPGEEPVRPEQ